MGAKAEEEPKASAEKDARSATSPDSYFLVVGDIMLDAMIFGTVDRLSPAGPYPVFRWRADNACYEHAGGAAGVARLLRGLGAECRVGGAVGGDTAGLAIRSNLRGLGINDELVIDMGTYWSTPAKTCFTAEHEGQRRQVWRIDRECEPLHHLFYDRAPKQAYLQTVRSCVAKAAMVLVCDHGKGVCRPELLKAIFKAAETARVPVLVDPACRNHEYWMRYVGATVLLPNRYEAETLLDTCLECNAQWGRAAEEIRQMMRAEKVLLKLDCDGAVLADQTVADATSRFYVPGTGNSVVDVTGAGDTLMAVLAYEWACGHSDRMALNTAMVAARMQVETFGVERVYLPRIRERQYRLRQRDEERVCNDEIGNGNHHGTA